MNKKRFLKVLMISLVMAAAFGLLASRAMAQNIPLQFQLSDELGQEIGGTVLLDNFQYWNSPRDMGWRPIELTYPMFGAGIGYGDLTCVVDFEEGSRVMDVNSMPSVFLPMGGSNFMPFTVTKMANYRDAAANEVWKGIPGTFSLMSLKVRAPLAIEAFDTFRIVVRVRTFASAVVGTGNVTVGGVNMDVPLGASTICGTAVGPYGIVDMVFTPREATVGCTPVATITNRSAVAPSVENTIYNAQGVAIPNATPTQLELALGRQFQDGSWHFVSEDLAPFVTAAFPGNSLFEIVSITLKGNQYRVDDVMFTNPALDLARNRAPYLFRIGPVYGQLFNTGQRRFVFAEDPDDLWLRNAAMLGVAAASPANFPFIEDAAGVADGAAGFDPLTARFVNPAAAAPRATLLGLPTLSFRFTVGDTLGPVTTMAQSLSIPPAAAINDNYMQMLPMIFPAFDVPARRWVANTGVANANNPMYVLACALSNSRSTPADPEWPNFRILTPAAGQVFEDQIVTCRVTDVLGVTDMETFPISVVNYPVTNQPPLIEQLEDQFFQVGQVGTYQITATDPEMADLVSLTYKATLNGLPSYQYGPWMNQIIDPINGTISFTPQFEGALNCLVTVSDPRGMQAVGSFTIFCVNPGTWLNHAPAVLNIIESPQIATAGELFTIGDLRIADPDGEQLYYSCNVGAVGRNGVYTFQSEFPGDYMVQITAYDRLGGAVTQQFLLQVMPWWSF